jgi:apolipoprotein N-acyltransferase
MPWRTFLSFVFPPLAEIASLEEDIIAGDSTAIADGGDVALGGIICFDSIYEPLARDSVRDGAELLLLSTNDSWFGTSRALYMHVAQARLRAIENSRGVLRAASTGVSCVISPTGAINASIGASAEGYVVADVLLSERDTPYTLVGNAFVYASIAFVFSLFAYQCARKCRKK